MNISKRAVETPASGIRTIFNKSVGLKDVIHLEIGEPDFPTPGIIKKEAKKALQENYTHYTHNAGLVELRQAIAEYYKQQGIEVTPESVIVTVGGTGALFLSALSLLDTGDEVLIPDPGYPSYLSMAKIVGAVPTPYKLKEKKSFLPDLGEVESKISKKTRAIIINTPNNPAGAVYPKEVLEDLLKLAEDRDFTIISDEVYEKITFEEKHHSVLEFGGCADNAIVVNSFSKTFAMTGWRLGFAVCKNDEMIKEMTKLQESTVACAPTIAQRATITPLSSVNEVSKNMVKEYRERRDLLIRLLSEIDGVSFITPKGTFYILLNISKYCKSSYSFAENLLLNRRVSVAPGRAFGEEGEGYIRISFANSEENIVKGIEQLRRELGA